MLEGEKKHTRRIPVFSKKSKRKIQEENCYGKGKDSSEETEVEDFQNLLGGRKRGWGGGGRKGAGEKNHLEISEAKKRLSPSIMYLAGEIRGKQSSGGMGGLHGTSSMPVNGGSRRRPPLGGNEKDACTFADWDANRKKDPE